MKVPKRAAGKPSRRATRSGRQQRRDEAGTKTSDLLPAVDWVRPQAPKPKKPSRDRKNRKR
jgi:hypothetical protein